VRKGRPYLVEVAGTSPDRDNRESHLFKLALFLLRFTGHDNPVGCALSAEEWNVRHNGSSRSGEPALSLSKGPSAKREPSPEGLGHRWTMIPSAAGAALSRSATQSNFAILGRGTSLSNELNATCRAVESLGICV
jgi:hypothetical protein